MKILLALLKQQFWMIALIFGATLVVAPCLNIDKDNHFKTHPPDPPVLLWVGISLLCLSVLSYGYTLFTPRGKEEPSAGQGVDLSRVKEDGGVLSTSVADCEIRVAYGRVEDYAHKQQMAVVLPCNEYFDDRCAGDTRSALGAYVSRIFEGQATEFVSLMKSECRRKFGRGTEQQKTDDERAESFGVGHCLLLQNPLGKAVPVALVSTTTQRAGEGLSGRISYLYDGMRELVIRLADARLDEVAMPVLGAGHGRISPPLAFVGLLLAIAEAARYGQGGQRLKRVTIVIFKPDENAEGEVDKLVVKRALALVASTD